MILIYAFLTVASAAMLQRMPPVWPDEFNSTLLKIGPDSTVQDTQWTKLYYKSSGYSRFDFYNHYLNLDRDWKVKCSIIFTPTDFWVYDFQSDKCTLRAGVPNLSQYWLKGAKFAGETEMRGITVEKWILETPDGDIEYFNRMDKWKTPLRSTNQAQDPGATDYFDFIVGPQDQDKFNLPKACDTPVKDVSCPSDDWKFLFQE